MFSYVPHDVCLSTNICVSIIKHDTNKTKIVTAVDRMRSLVIVKNEIVRIKIKDMGGNDIINKSIRISQSSQLQTLAE